MFLIIVCGVAVLFSCHLLPDLYAEPVFVFASEAPDSVVYVGVEYRFNRPNYTGINNIVKPPYFLIIFPVLKGGFQQTIHADITITKPNMTWKEFFDYVQTDTITVICAKDESSIVEWNDNHTDSLILNRLDLTPYNFDASKDIIRINIDKDYRLVIKP